MEDIEIEPLHDYRIDDLLVYSGVSVFLKDLGEPKTGEVGTQRNRADCSFPPENPIDLAPDMIPVVEPLLMVKEVQESGWDYCEFVNGRWRQVGLNPNPDAPLSDEFFANPVKEDREFDVCGDDDIPLREHHRQGFKNWISYLKG